MRKTVEKDAHRIGMLAHRAYTSNYNSTSPKYADILEVLAKVCHQRKYSFCLIFLIIHNLPQLLALKKM